MQGLNIYDPNRFVQDVIVGVLKGIIIGGIFEYLEKNGYRFSIYVLYLGVIIAMLGGQR
jgi:hypothetical protein